MSLARLATRVGRASCPLSRVDTPVEFASRVRGTYIVFRVVRVSLIEADGSLALVPFGAEAWAQPPPCVRVLPVGVRVAPTLESPQLLPMDILALATMKNAAKCDT